MGKGPEQTFLQRRYTNGKHVVYQVVKRYKVSDIRYISSGDAM